MTDEDDDLSPFQPLRARLAGEPVESTLHRRVPEYLAQFLRGWIAAACRLDDFVAQRAAMRLRVIPPQIPRVGQHAYARSDSSYVEALQQVPAEQVLEVVDAILFFHGAVGERIGGWLADYKDACLTPLSYALQDAGSAFRVADNLRQLVERVDATVTAAVEQTAEAADPTAAELLRDAWRQVYGWYPDPTTAYRQAVRAVEQVACPLVLPRNPKATLGTVISHLRDAGQRWSFALVDKDDACTVEPLVVMVERLWSGQVSRHGGGRNSRDQTQREAEAAVHLAVVLVQWLTAGALRKITP